MINKKNILVFPCGSEIGLDIYNSVKYSTYFHLIGGNSVDDHGRYVYKDYIDGIPFVEDIFFIPKLKGVVKKFGIDAIYPTMDSVIAKTKQYETELGCKVISSISETTNICLSKRKTYEILDGLVKVPKQYSSSTIIPSDCFPIFAKPNIGYSSRGTKKLYTQEEVNSFVNDAKDILLLEYLPGQEYTVDCFTDRTGKLLYCGARVRNRITNGISVNTFFVDNQREFQQIAEIINRHICFRGAWFFQVKRNSQGELVLLEIASRLGGSSLLSKAKGINLALLSLFDAFDYPINIFQNTFSVELDRALTSRYKTNLEFQSVYCDYDDCLIIDNKVNTELLSFIFKCLNEGKKVYLLTKHEDIEIENELQRYRLDKVFDGIFQIGKNDNKANYIIESNPIFIDDSHVERENVFKRLNIPVFSPEMIDVLL